MGSPHEEVKQMCLNELDKERNLFRGISPHLFIIPSKLKFFLAFIVVLPHWLFMLENDWVGGEKWVQRVHIRISWLVLLKYSLIPAPCRNHNRPSHNVLCGIMLNLTTTKTSYAINV